MSLLRAHSPTRAPVPRNLAIVMVLCGVVLVGVLPISATAEVGPPRGVHLSFTGETATTLTVTWFTDGHLDPGTWVEYGNDSTHLDRRVQGASHLVPEPDDIRVHSVTLTGLDPGQPVVYRAGSPSGWSDVWTTEAAPADGEPYRILLFADQGVGELASMVTDAMVAADPDLVLIAGDLAYAENDHTLWDAWFDMNEPLFATTPMMSSIGNHEGYSGYGAATYTSRVSQPDPEVYYSFDHGRIHYLVLESTTAHAMREGIYDDMVRFAEDDLARAAAARDAGRIDWVAVLQHHPLYSNHESTTRQFNAELVVWEEALLDRYDVDLLLTGHNHHYERSYPLVGGVPTTTEEEFYRDPVGTIQVISGGAGRALYDFQHPDDFWPHTAAYARNHHFVTIDVQGPTLEFVAVSAGYVPGERLDHFILETTRDADVASQIPRDPVTDLFGSAE